MTAHSAEKDALPPVGTYWTGGLLLTNHGPLEAYATCARCGAIVNSENRHDDWHDFIERVIPSEEGAS